LIGSGRGNGGFGAMKIEVVGNSSGGCRPLSGTAKGSGFCHVEIAEPVLLFSIRPEERTQRGVVLVWKVGPIKWLIWLYRGGLVGRRPAAGFVGNREGRF